MSEQSDVEAATPSAVETAKANLDRCKKSEAYYERQTGLGNDREAMPRYDEARSATAAAQEAYRNVKFDQQLQEGKERSAAQEAAREATRAEEIRQRDAATQTALAEAAQRDERHGRRPGESAAGWVEREKAAAAAKHIPGKGGQVVAASPAAVQALQREGTGPRPAAPAPGGSAPASKPSTKRLRGW